MYAITAANGQLGRLTLDRLIARVGASNVVAGVRDPSAASDLSALGVQVRQANYDRPETLKTAFEGVEKLLFISSNAPGGRMVQHGNVVAAAKKAGVGLIAYTSGLHADVSPMLLSADHRDTEAALAASGIPHVLLRNGWYSENHLASIGPALAQGALIGAAGTGRFSSASRADFADAAVAVLTSPDQAGKIYELAGDDAWTLADLAAEISRQANTPVVYQDLPEQAYADILVSIGLPAPMAKLFADSDAAAARGALFDDCKVLSQLIGRPTTPLSQSVAEALASAAQPTGPT